MYNSRSKNDFCLRAGNVFPNPCLWDKWKNGGVEEITAVNYLNKDSCPEVSSGSTSSCCLFSRDCLQQVPDSTAGSWWGTEAAQEYGWEPGLGLSKDFGDFV